jgi:hypothetical protein
MTGEPQNKTKPDAPHVEPRPERSPEPGLELSPDAGSRPRLQAPLPGLAAIALYLLLLAGTIILGVVAGAHYPPVYLVFAALFITACAGLLMQFRWAWALALAAVALLATYNFWIFSGRHAAPALVQGALNLVFFLYLIRPEVRSRLH